MTKLIVGLLVAAVAAYVLNRRVAEGRRKVSEIDEGRRCAACDSTEMAVSGDRARCRLCGQVVNLAALRAEQLSADQMAAIASVDRRRPLD
jgi:hypothetical protein